MVPKILWSAAKHDLGFEVTRETRQQWQEELHYRPFAFFHDTTTKHTVSAAPQGDTYTALAKIHNQLLRDYERLTRDDQSSFPSVALCECPGMLRNPTTRLTDNAAKLLLEKAQQIADYLHAARTIASRRRSAKQPVSVFDRLIKTYTPPGSESVSPA